MKPIRSIIAILVTTSFVLTSINLPVYAQTFVDPMPKMPAAGAMVHLSPEFAPAYLKGIVIHPENALKFDFIIFKGDNKLTNEQKRVEYTKLAKYFLASLAIPDDDQWVNLSPYEKNRIIKDDFGKTEMGRDLLAQDYMLKQITASLIYPEDQLGKKFWNKVYATAQAQYGTTNIPVNTFNKVWILPDDALIYEKGNAAYVLKNHLKVMMEEDYLSLKKHTGISTVIPAKAPPSDGAPPEAVAGIQNMAHTIASQIVKQIVLPALEREVNEGKNFAAVRQVFSGVVLAAWYKRALKESLLGKIYMNKSRVKGVDQDPQNNEKIYRQYLRAYRKGVFNFIKEDVDKYTHEIIPRKYFSGGFQAARAYNEGDPAIKDGEPVLKIEKTATPPQNEAMLAEVTGNRDDLAQVAVAESREATNLSARISRGQVPSAAMTSRGNSNWQKVFIKREDVDKITIRQGDLYENITKRPEGYDLEMYAEFLDFARENPTFANEFFKAEVSEDGGLLLQSLGSDVAITKTKYIAPGKEWGIRIVDGDLNNGYKVYIDETLVEKFGISDGKFLSQRLGRVLSDGKNEYPGFVVTVQNGDLTIKNTSQDHTVSLDVDLAMGTSQTLANAAMTARQIIKSLVGLTMAGFLLNQSSDHELTILNNRHKGVSVQSYKSGAAAYKANRPSQASVKLLPKAPAPAAAPTPTDQRSPQQIIFEGIKNFSNSEAPPFQRLGSDAVKKIIALGEKAVPFLKAIASSTELNGEMRMLALGLLAQTVNPNSVDDMKFLEDVQKNTTGEFDEKQQEQAQVALYDIIHREKYNVSVDPELPWFDELAGVTNHEEAGSFLGFKVMLGRLEADDRTAIPSLEKIAENSPDPALRRWAIEFLNIYSNTDQDENNGNQAMTASEMEAFLNERGVEQVEGMLKEMLKVVPPDKQGEILNKMKEAKELFNVHHESAKAAEAYLKAFQLAESYMDKSGEEMTAMKVRQFLDSPAVGRTGLEGWLDELIKMIPSLNDRNKIAEIMNQAGGLLDKNQSSQEAAELYSIAFLFANIAIKNAEKSGGTGSKLGDAAMTTMAPIAALTQKAHDSYGGIDFNAANLNLQIKRDGRGVPLPISQQNLESIHIDGLIPVVLAIQPAAETSLLSELALS